MLGIFLVVHGALRYGTFKPLHAACTLYCMYTVMDYVCTRTYSIVLYHVNPSMSKRFFFERYLQKNSEKMESFVVKNRTEDDAET